MSAARVPAADRLDGWRQFAPPALLLIAVGVVGAFMSQATQQDFTSVLVNATIVIALYVFIGNSGVISFGQISFVAIGAFSAGVLTIPAITKPTVMPQLFPFLQDTTIATFPSLVVAAGLGALFALIAGAPLMRLSGLAAGIATFAVLQIVHNILRFWEKIGPGAQTLSLVPETVGLFEATLGAVFAAGVAFAYQRSRSGRLLRASREDPHAAMGIGVSIHRQRLIAFTISGGLAGLAGGLLVHSIGSITTEQVYLQLTFITLAMLIVGGLRSLWGAVVGAVLVSFLDTLLVDAEGGLSLAAVTIDLPRGASFVVLGALMAAMLILRPDGITRGREATLRVPRIPDRFRGSSGGGRPGDSGGSKAAAQP